MVRGKGGAATALEWQAQPDDQGCREPTLQSPATHLSWPQASSSSSHVWLEPRLTELPDHRHPRRWTAVGLESASGAGIPSPVPRPRRAPVTAATDPGWPGVPARAWRTVLPKRSSLADGLYVAGASSKPLTYILFFFYDTYEFSKNSLWL